MNKQIKRQSGFTLIELMIVVAIVGILAAIAIPGYMDYTIRAQATEAISLANGVKTTISEYYSHYGTMAAVGSVGPMNDGSGGLPAAGVVHGRYVATQAVTLGQIISTYGLESNAAIAGQTLNFNPWVANTVGEASAIFFRCNALGSSIATPANSAAPTGATGASAGTLLAKYAPLACR